MEVMALIVTHMVVAAHMVVAVVMVSHLAILPTIIKVMVVVMEAMEEPDIRPLIMNHFQHVCKCEAYLSTYRLLKSKNSLHHWFLLIFDLVIMKMAAQLVMATWNFQLLMKPNKLFEKIVRISDLGIKLFYITISYNVRYVELFPGSSMKLFPEASYTSIMSPGTKPFAADSVSPYGYGYGYGAASAATAAATAAAAATNTRNPYADFASAGASGAAGAKSYQW